MASIPVLTFQNTVSRGGQLDKDFYEVALDDIYRTLQYTAAAEIQEQIEINNRPTSVLVDGRATRSLEGAQKRIRAFFVDTSDVYSALRDALLLISELVPRRSGRAAFSYEIWFNETRIGKDLSAVQGRIQSMGPSDYVRVVGPVVAYGRKVNYNPTGTKKFTRKTVLRVKGTTFRAVKVQGIMERVEKTIGRRYPGLYVRESWVRTTALPKDGRTPGIVIGVSKRGGLRES